MLLQLILPLFRDSGHKAEVCAVLENIMGFDPAS